MVISHAKKFLFIHNYKVAGTSVRDALAPYSNDNFFRSKPTDQLKLVLQIYPWIFSNDFSAHIRAKEAKAKISPKIFDSYFKFGFVRNPWDWQVSLYKFMLKNPKHQQHEFISKLKNFREYIDWRVHNEVRLQKDFFYDELGNCLMDFVGKLENINEDFATICQRLHLSTTLPTLNTSRPDKNFQKYYDADTIQMVKEAYQEDITTFGYEEPALATQQSL